MIPTPYNTIAEAEAVITNAGYVRDTQRHIWVLPGTPRTAKVVRLSLQFYVEWG